MRKLLEKEHKQFLEAMHRDFGLPTAPATITVKLVEGLENNGGLVIEESGIWVGRGRSFWKTSLDLCIHESAHYLHCLGNPEISKKLESNLKMKRSASDLNVPLIRVVEFISQLATITYRARQFPQRREFFHRYVERESNDGIFELFLPAYCAYKANPHLLNQITTKSLPESCSAIDCIFNAYGTRELNFEKHY